MGKYNLVTVRPTVSHLYAEASGGTDVLFDWHAFEIPKGACLVKHISGTVMGLNGAAGNDDDFKLWFARSINGVAPTTFGTAHTTNTAAETQAFRRNIIGFTFVDASTVDDGDALIGYNVFGSRGSESLEQPNMMLQGDPMYASTEGYQTIWVAAEAAGSALEFGTDVDLNMAGHQAASTAAVQITVSGTDARLAFQAGDSIVGSTGGPTMEVVTVDSDVLMTVKNVSEQIDHQEELLHKNPITLHFGCEY